MEVAVTFDRLEERGVERAIVMQSDQQWNCFQRTDIRETPERQGGAHVGLPERIDYYLDMNRTETRKHLVLSSLD